MYVLQTTNVRVEKKKNLYGRKVVIPSGSFRTITITGTAILGNLIFKTGDSRQVIEIPKLNPTFSERVRLGIAPLLVHGKLV